MTIEEAKGLRATKRIQEILADPFADEAELLTPRERLIARQASRGATYVQVSASMGVTRNTAANAIKVVCHKLGVRKNELPRLVFEKIEDVLASARTGGQR